MAVCVPLLWMGGVTNMASTTLAEKLTHKAEALPQPYSIQWLNQGKGLQVSHHCLVSFPICKSYCDELWCDIIPKDACHILLG